MRSILFVVAILTTFMVNSQSFTMSSLIPDISESGTIKGQLLDSETNNEPLAFATISIKSTVLETTSDLNGSFSFNLKPGNYTLQISFIGYNTVELIDIEVVANNTTILTQKLMALKPNLDITMAN